MSNYTIKVVDSNNLIASSVERQIESNAYYVAELLTRYIDWKGVLDIEIRIESAAASPYPAADGILPTLSQISWDGFNWSNDTLYESLTGIDKNSNIPDTGATIYLSEDGSIKNYGMPAWFDPSPAFDSKPNIPDGHFDFIGVLTHEIFHGLGVYAATKEWQALTIEKGGQLYFVGSETVELYGGPLPLSNDHYGNTNLPDNKVQSGLMFQWGLYDNNRLDIGRIDLAILKDLGHNIKSYDDLTLFELVDSRSTIDGTADDEYLFGDFRDNLISSGGGSDVVDGGAGIDTLILSNEYSSYRLNLSSEQSQLSGSGESISFKNIERLHFTDRNIALDLDGNAGLAAKITGVTLGAESISDAQHEGLMLSYLDSGMSVTQVMQIALDSVLGKNASSESVINLGVLP